MKSSVLFLLLLSGVAFAGDPRTALPTHVHSNYQVDTLFGPENGFSDTDIDILNYIEQQGERSLDFRYPTNILFFPDATMTVEESLDFIGEEVRVLQIDNLTVGDWATAAPVTLEEALNRMSALLKSLNGAVAIP